MNINNQQGYIKTKNGRVWFKVAGKSKGIPVFLVHGGPGCSHHYLQPLEDLGRSRPVIFYEQINSGKSDKLTDQAKWTPQTFFEELGEVVSYFDFEEYHLLGQSWGSAVVTGFALEKPKGLKSLVLSDPYIGTPMWMKDATRLLSRLPAKMQEILAGGDTESEEYKHASLEYYYRHVNRMKKIPAAISKSPFNNEMYQAMWGPKEFQLIGSLEKFDLAPRLKEIKVPVLLISGKYDEATPEANRYFASLISKATTKVLPNSAHLPFWTDRKEYMKAVEDFLEKSEKQS